MGKRSPLPLTVLRSVLLILLIGGCDTCSPEGCDLVRSLPPLDNPLARALEIRTAYSNLHFRMNVAAQTQYALLGNRWPASSTCDQIAKPGCDYRVNLLLDFSALGRHCESAEFFVVENDQGLPIVRPGMARQIACPKL
jgi:hypothetical protein